MTQEQYKRAVEIGNRLEELKIAKSEIFNDEAFLYYGHKDDYNIAPCSERPMNYIRDILDRHDKMIREEIDNEIEKLKKEIEKL